MPIILNGTTGITTPGITNTGPFVFQGVVELPAGAVGAPSLTTTGDTNTGIYFPAANQVAIATDGAQRVFVGATGDVGIGTGGPGAKLDIRSGNLFFSSTSTTANTTLASIGVYQATYPTTNQYASIDFLNGPSSWFSGSAIVFKTNGSADTTANAATEKMRLDGSGNLGLGVTPSAWGSGSQALQNQAGALFTVGTGSLRLFHNTFYDGTNNKYVNTAAAAGYIQVGGAHQWFNAASGTAGTNATFTQAMTLDASGNLGVGTTSPDARLSVNGAASFADGTSSAPSVTNIGDLDTGVYFPAANEVAVSTGGTVATAFNSNGLFFRNRIINGDMRIDQRNNGASVTVNSSSAPYCPDRWNSRVQQASGAFTVQRSTTVPTGAGFNNSVFLTVTNTTAAGSTNRVHIRQIIEGYNIADLGWGTASALTITLSFWVRSSVTGTYGVGFINSSETRSYVGTYVVNSANTWEKKSITVPGDTSGTWETGDSNGIRVTFDLGSGSSYNASSANTWVAQEAARTSSCVNWQQNSGATLYLTGVQLETGSVATPFERRPYGIEFLLCQRYYQENIGETGAGNEMMPFTMNYGTAFTSANYRWIAFSWPVEMRATPTVTFYPTGGSKADPGNALYLTGTGGGAGNKLAPYGIALSPKMATLKSYNEYAAFTCFGVVAGYSASAEL